MLWWVHCNTVNFPNFNPLKLTPFNIVGSGTDHSFIALDFYRVWGLLGEDIMFGNDHVILSWDIDLETTSRLNNMVELVWLVARNFSHWCSFYSPSSFRWKVETMKTGYGQFNRH